MGNSSGVASAKTYPRPSESPANARAFPKVEKPTRSAKRIRAGGIARRESVVGASVRHFLRDYEQSKNFSGSCESYRFYEHIRRWRMEKRDEFAFGEEQRRFGTDKERGRVVFADLTLFQVACWAADARLVGKHLQAGAEANLAIDASRRGEFAGCAPLHLALCGLRPAQSHAKETSTARVLLDHGADVNCRDKRGNTPLHLVLSQPGEVDHKLVRLLVSRGADYDITNERGETPFDSLLATHSLLQVEAFIRADGSVYVFCPANGRTCTAMMMMLHWISRRSGADSACILQLDEQKCAATLKARCRGTGAGCVKILYRDLPMLIDVFRKLGGNINCQDRFGKTLLHYAVDFHNSEVVSLLLKSGSDINITDANESSALASSLSFSKLTMTEQQISQNNGIINTLVSHLHKLKLEDSYVTKHNENYLCKANKLNMINYKSALLI